MKEYNLYTILLILYLKKITLLLFEILQIKGILKETLKTKDNIYKYFKTIFKNPLCLSKSLFSRKNVEFLISATKMLNHWKLPFFFVNSFNCLAIHLRFQIHAYQFYSYYILLLYIIFWRNSIFNTTINKSSF